MAFDPILTPHPSKASFNPRLHQTEHSKIKLMAWYQLIGISFSSRLTLSSNAQIMIIGHLALSYFGASLAIFAGVLGWTRSSPQREPNLWSFSAEQESNHLAPTEGSCDRGAVAAERGIEQLPDDW